MDLMQDYGAREWAIWQNRTSATSFGGWKTQATETYRRQRHGESRDLRASLAERVRLLTGREVAEDAMRVDPDERAAWATVDGVRFRLERARLTLRRACELCGSGEFSSLEILSLADLGYALSVWQPRHPTCQPDDPPGWLEDDAATRHEPV
jgi:hypothetical protein